MSAIDRVYSVVSSLKRASSNYIITTKGAADHLDGIKIEVPNDIVFISELKLNEIYDKISHIFLIDCPNLLLDASFCEAICRMHNLRQIDLSGTTMQTVDNIDVLTQNNIYDSDSGMYVRRYLSHLSHEYSLMRISMPNTYTKVSSNAFNGCSNLIEFSAPECRIIEDYAFAFCQHMITINAPHCQTIGNYALAGFGREELEFENCNSLGNYALSDCEFLKKVILGPYVNIGSYAFHNCNSLKELILPAGSELAPYALANSGLTYIEASKCVRVGGYAFNGLEIEVLELSACTDIGDHAFYQSSLENIILSSCTTIGESAFKQCSINEIYLPACLLISSEVFYESSVVSVSLPKVVDVYDHVFYRCSNLQSITIPFNINMPSNSECFSYCYNLSTLYLIWTDSYTDTTGSIALSDLLSGIPDTAQITLIDVKMVDGSDIADGKQLTITDTKEGSQTLTRANPGWSANS